MLDVSKDPRHPSGPWQGHAAVFPHLLPQQIQLSVPSDPCHPLHNINMQLLVFVSFLFFFFKCTMAALLTPHPFAPHLLLFQLCCSQTQGLNKTLHRMVNVLNNVKA